MEKITENFNLKNLKKKENIIEFATQLFEEAKQKLNIENGDITFKKLDYGNGYKYEENVTLNLKNFKLKNLHSIVNSVFHETRHLYQSQTRIPKNLNECKTPSLPLEICKDFIYLIDEEVTYLNPFYLYYTCQTEKDARDYAHFETYKFFRNLKFSTPQSDTKTHKFLDKQLEKINKEKQQEEQNYKTRLNRIKIYESDISKRMHFFSEYIITKTTKAFMDTINAKSKKEQAEAQKTVDSLHKYYSAILTLYADEEITNLLLDYALDHKNLDCIYAILNSNYTNINQEVQNKIFGFMKDNNIDLNEVKPHITNLNFEQFSQAYNIFINPINQTSPIYFTDDDAKNYLKNKISYNQKHEEDLSK